MPRLPSINGKDLIKFLNSVGFIIIRQKCSHVRLKSETAE
ncbi:MAG: type II toxin-antitoxin system HicA family toxin [Candidatus Thorarchaeota archaeon]